MALRLIKAGVIGGGWVVIDSTGLEAFFKADPADLVEDIAEGGEGGGGVRLSTPTQG